MPRTEEADCLNEGYVVNTTESLDGAPRDSLRVLTLDSVPFAQAPDTALKARVRAGYVFENLNHFCLPV